MNSNELKKMIGWRISSSRILRRVTRHLFPDVSNKPSGIILWAHQGPRTVKPCNQRICYHYVASKLRWRNTQRSSVTNQEKCFLITYFCLTEAKWAAFRLGGREDRGCNLSPDIRHTVWRLSSFLPIPPRKCRANTSHYVTPLFLLHASTLIIYWHYLQHCTPSFFQSRNHTN